ncbi:MAG TPA: hypothetical protein VHC93_24250 [Methylomirabilota bacterium]|jgi:hypothetical protein|nr:hypothetical protein [Streptosporangiaceae bacterium]HEV3350225.1 hypothetical protein [Methylomirabilota bacterium]
MSTVTSYEPSQARLAGLCRQAQVDALFASWLQQSVRHEVACDEWNSSKEGRLMSTA